MNTDTARELHFEAFRQVFKLVKPETFGHGREGRHDGNEGVQWNAWVDQGGDGLVSGHVGVNLEGMEYDGWPIARLIDRELGSFSLFKTIKTIASVDKPEDITVRWTRDVWVGSKLPPNYPEHLILCESASELTEDRWRTNLFEAQRCLDPKRDFRGRARQSITLQGGTKDLYVSPHLGFVLELWRGKPQSEAGLIEPMQDVFDTLEWPSSILGNGPPAMTKAVTLKAARVLEGTDAQEKSERDAVRRDPPRV